MYQSIISNITVREIKTAAEQGKKNANSKKTIVRNPNWFAEVQNHLIDDEVLREQLMVSRLYKEMEKIQKTSEKGMDDPDALAYADAYLQALDLGKHGRKIKLKKELRRAAGIPDCYCVDP